MLLVRTIILKLILTIYSDKPTIVSATKSVTVPQQEVEDVLTTNNLQYQFYPASTESVHFKVRAPNDAHIGLTQSPRKSKPIVEIFIGGWGNTKSAIRKNKTKPDVAETETNGILNGSEYRGFWVRWAGGVISVCREGEDIPFLSWVDPHPFPIGYVGICTGWGASGSWKIEDKPTKVSVTNDPNESVTVPQKEVEDVLTTDNLQYQFYPASTESVHFKVRAPNDAHIGLTQSPRKSKPIVEIFIGGWGNTKSVIRKNKTKPDVAETETNDILNGSEYRGFWVRWAGGVISVCREGEDIPFLSWVDPHPFPIGYVGICTGWGAFGSWKIEDKPTKVSATNDPNESVTVPQKEVEGRSGTTTILIVAFSTMVLTSILAFIIFKVVLQRRLNKAQVVDQGLQSPPVDEPHYETVDSCIDISKRAPYPLPAEALKENIKYVHYDTPYEWRIWRFGVIPKCREQPPRRRGSQDIQS